MVDILTLSLTNGAQVLVMFVMLVVAFTLFHCEVQPEHSESRILVTSLQIHLQNTPSDTHTSSDQIKTITR
jgi:hypothetical protein